MPRGAALNFVHCFAKLSILLNRIAFAFCGLTRGEATSFCARIKRATEVRALSLRSGFDSQRRVPGVYLSWANRVLLAFFAFNGINNLSAFNVAFSSIPTAPTNHLSDGWTLNKNMRGQKGADKTVGPVFLCGLSAARVTTGFTGLKVQEAFPRTSYYGHRGRCPVTALLRT